MAEKRPDEPWMSCWIILVKSLPPFHRQHGWMTDQKTRKSSFINLPKIIFHGNPNENIRYVYTRVTRYVLRSTGFIGFYEKRTSSGVNSNTSGSLRSSQCNFSWIKGHNVCDCCEVDGQQSTAVTN